MILSVAALFLYKNKRKEADSNRQQRPPTCQEIEKEFQTTCRITLSAVFRGKKLFFCFAPLLERKKNMSEEKKTINTEFNPAAYARDVYDNGILVGKTLDVKYRKLWFRTVFPNGKIQQIIHTLDSQTAVVEARVYADKGDAPEAFLSNSFAQRTLDTNTEFGTSYLECAATAAVGRALADAGFGTQFCVEPEDSNQKPVDSPVPVQQKPSSPKTDEPPVSSSLEGLTDDTPVEVVVKRLQYADAVRVQLKGGKHKGRLLGEVAEEDFGYLKWIVEKATTNLLKGAAIIICRKHGVEVKV